MKTTSKILVVAILALGVQLTSCKKYEDGPAISLKSKNKRLVGDWELEKLEGISSYEDFLYYSYSDFLDGTINFSSSEKNNMEISFENGMLSYNYIMEYSDISPYDTINETDSDIYTENYFENLTISENSNYSWSSGGDSSSFTQNDVWSWLDGTSNKELIMFNDMVTFRILKLTKDELVFESANDYENTYDFSNQQGSIKEETYMNYTFKKK